MSRLGVLGFLVGVLLGGAAVGMCPVGDVDGDCDVDWRDVESLAGMWLDANCVWPVCGGDVDGLGDVNGVDFSLLAGNWGADHNLPADITWLGHASFRIVWNGRTIYIDPRNLGISPHDATLVLVTHSHGDHYSPTDIANVSWAGTILVASMDVVQSQGGGIALLPAESVEVGGVRIIAVAAYNLEKSYHPRSKNWIGFVIEAGPLRIYNAGDTDMTPEMTALRDIDVAILSVGGTYTMTGAEAASATQYILPGLGIPAHWGGTIGTLADAEEFAALAACPVVIMSAGQTINTDDPIEPEPGR